MHMHACSPRQGQQLPAGPRTAVRIGRGQALGGLGSPCQPFCRQTAGASAARCKGSRVVAARAAAAAPPAVPGMAAAFGAGRLSPTSLEALPPDTAQRFQGVMAVQSGLLSKIADRLGLAPLPEGEFTGSLQASSPDGKASTCLQTFGGEKLARLTTGCAALSFPTPTGYSRLTAWVDDSIDAPHLSVELIYYGDTGLLWAHLMPRKDGALDWSYLYRLYAQPPPGCSRSWVALDAACEAREDWRPFKSSQPLVRWMASGLAIAYWLPPNGLEAAGEVAREAVDMWLALLGSAAAVPEGERAALAVRDLALRRAGTWGDAHFPMMEKLYGAAALERMGRLLTGAPRPQ